MGGEACEDYMPQYNKGFLGDLQGQEVGVGELVSRGREKGWVFSEGKLGKGITFDM
jgi:hypothetical protein